MKSGKRRRVLTGIKPTGVPHIGNYLGAIRPALGLAEDHDAFFFIADLHALTSAPDPKLLVEQTYSVAASWLAFGLDPRKAVFYRQSDVPEIPMLAWALACVTPFGLLRRAHSFKDAQGKGKSEEDINAGLFSYPVLMAADILLFDTELVPVGKDQKQHLEIAQEAARKFNNLYGDVLRVPEPLIDEAVMTVPGTDGQKMSKSRENTITLFVPDKELTKTVTKKIVTNSTPYGEPLSPEGETVFTLYRLLAQPEETAALLAKYESGRKDPQVSDQALEDPTTNYFGWGDAKKALAELLLERFGEVRSEYDRLMADKGHLDRLLQDGADRARSVASETLERVLRATGLRAGTA